MLRQQPEPEPEGAGNDRRDEHGDKGQADQTVKSMLRYVPSQDRQALHPATTGPGTAGSVTGSGESAGPGQTG